MTVDTEAEMAALRKAGQVVALTLQAMVEAAKPGISTLELDQIGAAMLAKHGAKSAPRVMYNFPGDTCISLNNEAAHGIPSETRIVKEGDLLNLDVSAVLDDFYSDTATTLQIGEVSSIKAKLCAVSQESLANGIAAARAGLPLNGIGRVVEETATKHGFTSIRNLPGHGIGRSLHEPPSVLNFYHPKMKEILHEGMVFTIEPFISNGAHQVDEADDGWTLLTPRGEFCAQYEHTIVVQKGKAIILTELQ